MSAPEGLWGNAGGVIVAAHGLTGLPVEYRIPARLGGVSLGFFDALAGCHLPEPSRDVAWSAKLEDRLLPCAITLAARSGSHQQFAEHFAQRWLAGANLRRALALPSRGRWTAERIIGLHDAVSDVGHARGLRGAPVWINKNGPSDSEYVAPPASEVPGLVGDLVTFLGREDLTPSVRGFLGFLQLSCIHPFRDGNGRTARVLAIILMRQHGASAALTALCLARLASRPEQLHRAANMFVRGSLVEFAALVEDSGGCTSRQLGAVSDLLGSTEEALFQLGRANGARSTELQRLIADLMRAPVGTGQEMTNRFARMGRGAEPLLKAFRDSGAMQRASGTGSQSDCWIVVPVRQAWSEIASLAVTSESRACDGPSP